jgi:hypothetical protein
MHGIEAAVRRETGAIALSFVLEGDLTLLRIPAPHPPGIGERLWRHTCFEVFIGAAGTAAYHELNLSPSGEWAAHAFRAYRDGGPLRDAGLAPGIAVRRGTDRLELDAIVRLDRLSPAYRRVALRLGLSAVVEAADGALSYWALRHPPGRPDFHHADAFALALEPAA